MSTTTTATTNSIHVVAVTGERPPPSSPRNAGSDQIVPKQVDHHHHHHRFVPPSISLQSDAPGYYQNNNNENGTSSPMLHNKRGNTTDGPICWKCRGTGQKKQRPTTPSSGPAVTATTVTTAKMNDDHAMMAACCTVCHGKGRIMIIPRPPPHINDDDNDDDNDDRGGVGLITRGRRRRRRSGAVSTVNTLEKDASSISRWLDPVGYSVPYFGALVQRATTQCVDVRIVYQNNHHHHSLQQRPPTIRRIDIGNHRTTDGTICNTKTTSHNDIDTTTNHNINANIVTPEQVPNHVMEAHHPIWLPIHQPQEQLCNFVGHWRILQRYKSHRYTTDDVVTAMVACRECFQVVDHSYRSSTSSSSGSDPIPISYCDLGTGNGSVLQMVLWKVLESSAVPHDNHHPLQCVYGFEARQEAVELLLRSLAFNIGTGTSLRNKVTIVRADFRSYCHDPSRAPLLHQKFDVVTGTPPYFQVDFHIPVSSTSPPISYDNNTDRNLDTQSPHPGAGTTNITATIRQGGMPLSIQSAPARCEFRGGIEAYCCTASYLLKPGSGLLCICENYCNHQRALQSFDAHRLILTKYYIIEGKVGRGPLFCVYVARKEANGESDDVNNETTLSPDIIQLAVRDTYGEWTDDYKRLVLDFMSIIY